MGEGASLLAAVESIPAEGPSGPTIILVVLNARDDSPPAVHAANDAARAALAGCPNVVTIDRARPGARLPDREGVGLARKIGCDAALAWIAAGAVRSRYIHTTDADAMLPPDYLAAAAAHESLAAPPAALIHPFRHRPADWPGAAAAITEYELWLRAHRLRLARAGSPYAFQAIGSTLVLEADAYAAVRGFPRSMAGEDFYLLDKLAKFGAVRHVGGGPVMLDGRVSGRVPFGTGRAMGEAAAGAAGTGARRRFLDPRGYDALAAWLEVLEEAATNDGPRGWPALRARLASRMGRNDQELVATTLESMAAPRALVSAAAMNLDPRTWLRRMHTWFDAFRTLRFLHTLRDRAWPAVGWQSGLAGLGIEGRDAGGGVDSVAVEPAAADSGSANPAAALAALQRLDETTAPVAGVPPKISAITAWR